VLVDDRPQLSAGVKFTDAELIGIAWSVVVGRRFPQGYAELRDRRTGERTEVSLADYHAVVAHVRRLLICDAESGPRSASRPRRPATARRGGVLSQRD
jgi:hypothetical protein